MPVSFFRFLQGVTDFQDRISPLLVNNSLKRVFKRRLKVTLRHISLWKAWTVFDWRRNLSLRKSISVLIGGVFERLFTPRGFKMPGGMLKLQFDWYINCFHVTSATGLGRQSEDLNFMVVLHQDGAYRYLVTWGHLTNKMQRNTGQHSKDFWSDPPNQTEKKNAPRAGWSEYWIL